MEDLQWLKDLQRSRDLATDAMEALRALEATEIALPPGMTMIPKFSNVSRGASIPTAIPNSSNVSRVL